MIEDAQGSALELLRSAGLLSLPIDIVAAAQHCDVRVEVTGQLPASVSGLLYRGRYRDEILVNARDPLPRRRFTVAHELGHWWYGDRGIAMREDDCGAEYQTEQERAVDLFAAELLMPAHLVQEELLRCGDLRGLSWRFHVSQPAMRRRLHELGLCADPGRRQRSVEPLDYP